MEPDVIEQLKYQLNNAQKILIALPENPDTDQISAGLSLHLSLIKIKKQVQIISPTPIMVEHNRLIGVDQISHRLSGKNLVITLPYQQEIIEKVYTEIKKETGHFQIIIEPRKGVQPPDHQQLQFSYLGVNTDILILISSPEASHLSTVVSDLEDLTQNSQIVRISHTMHPPQPRLMDFVQHSVLSVSEVTYQLLQELKYPIDEDIATNILAGIDYGTRQLTHPHVPADTFEIVAACLKLGAVRGYSLPEKNVTVSKFPSDKQIENDVPIANSNLFNNNNANNSTTEIQPTEITDHYPVTNSVHKNIKNQSVPDWLMPKIYNTPHTG